MTGGDRYSDATSANDDLNEEDDMNFDDRFQELNLNQINRDEGGIYESIEEELDSNYDEVVRDLPEFDPVEDLDIDLDDSRGG